MSNRDFFRDLLVADLAVVLEPAAAKAVATAISRYWEDREDAERGLDDVLRQVAGLSGSGLRRIEEEVDRLVADAGGSSEVAFRRRGGLSGSLRDSLPAGVGARLLDETTIGPPPALRRLEPGRYRDMTRIGEGGMGVVFRAFDSDLERPVAMKVLKAEAGVTKGAAERFLVEARVTSRLEHPGIVPVYTVGETPEGLPCYSMRYVRGGRTLADAIAAAAGIEERLGLLDPFLRVCDTMRYAHSRGILHRDLKPANVALGEFGEVLVLDWGLARIGSGHGNGEPTGRVVGTPGYVSPEAARGDDAAVSERSDVYGLGATLFEILTGRRPFEARSLADLREHLDRGAPPLATDLEPAAPAPLAAIARRALAPRPEDRPDTVAELAEAVRAWWRQDEADREVELEIARAETAREGVEGLAGDDLIARLDRIGGIALRVRELRADDERAGELLQFASSRRDAAIAGRQRRARIRTLRRVAVASLVLVALATTGVAFLLDQRRKEAVAAREEADDLAGFMLLDLSRGLADLGRLDLLGPVARKAKAYYERQDDRGEGLAARARRALALFQVGDVLWSEGDLAAALDAHLESRVLREELVRAAPGDEDREGDLIDSHCRISDVLLDMRRETEAIDWLDRIRDRSDRSSRRPLVRARLGSLLARRGDESGLDFAESAVDDLRRSVVERPDDEWSHRSLAYAARVAATILSDRGRTDEALDLLALVLESRRALAASRPDSAPTKLDLSDALLQVGAIEARHGRFGPAQSHLDEAVALERWLVGHDPSNVHWRSRFAGALLASGDARRLAGDAAGAEGDYAKGLDLAREAARTDPANRDVAVRLVAFIERTADSARATGAMERALGLYRESLGIREELLAHAPGLEARGNVASARGRIGTVLAATGENAAAIDAFRTALDEFLRLAEEDPEHAWWHEAAADLGGRLGDLVSRTDPDEAERCYRTAATALGALRERDPANVIWMEELATVRSALGDLLSKRGDAPASEAELVAAVELRQRGVELSPDDPVRQSRLAHARARLGNACAREGRMADAARLYEAALAAHSAALARDSSLASAHAWYEEQARRYAVISRARPPGNPREHYELGLELHRSGRNREAVESFRIALGDPAVRDEPGRPALWFAVRAAALSATELASSDPEEAARLRALGLAWLAEDIAGRRRLAADDPVAREQLDAVIEAARTAPELASLRAEPGFAELLGE